MQGNSKQEPEGFFSLMFQFALMMLVFWLICCLLKPLFPEEKELGEYDENGKRNFQYACDYRTINEEESEQSEEEIFSGEEFADASYNVERFINDVYSQMVLVYNRYLNANIEEEHIEVKKYNFFADTDVFISEVDGKTVLVIEEDIKRREDISDELELEIMIAITEIYSEGLHSTMITETPFSTYEEKDFGPGIKRLVYEDLVNYYLEKNPNPICFFLNNQIQDFNRLVLEGYYENVEQQYEECITQKANIRGFYTALEALEMHLQDYYGYEENEHAYICCLELALMPGLIEENGIEKDKAYEMITDNVPSQYWSYLKRLI